MSETYSKKLYNPEHHYQARNELLQNVLPDECDAWYKSPCTQALIHSLQGDVHATFLTWAGGGYLSEESVDATAQMMAKVRGTVEAGNDVIEAIYSYKNGVVLDDLEEYED